MTPTKAWDGPKANGTGAAGAPGAAGAMAGAAGATAGMAGTPGAAMVTYLSVYCGLAQRKRVQFRAKVYSWSTKLGENSVANNVLIDCDYY